MVIFVLPKDKITVGTVIEFEKLLVEKFGEKFKNKSFKDDAVAKEEQKIVETTTPAEEVSTSVDEETPTEEVQEEQSNVINENNTDSTNNE